MTKGLGNVLAVVIFLMLAVSMLIIMASILYKQQLFGSQLSQAQSLLSQKAQENLDVKTNVLTNANNLVVSVTVTITNKGSTESFIKYLMAVQYNNGQGSLICMQDLGVTLAPGQTYSTTLTNPNLLSSTNNNRNIYILVVTSYGNVFYSNLG